MTGTENRPENGPESEAAREREALALFEVLFDVGSAEREAWIRVQTQGRPEVRRRLLDMLAADMRMSLQTGGAVDALEVDDPPERIGAYRIAERIGRGGMGSVYRGERISGDFAHVVAIKIIKPGLLSAALVERFERERQILAGLSHPNIAQLYDGGRTAEGSPYIVMELVQGIPLLDWANDVEATVAERLAVFRQVCAGVAFAHRNLMVHRDLTPSNVLVTREGAVKLIDFGIARPADEPDERDEDAQPASLASLSLTPGYAAPERHTSNAVTTAADIYSLGKLLERLLAGEDSAEMNAIVAKATAHAAADRYATVEALVGDLAAWERRMPVSAMGDSRRYVWRKFVSRNRRAVAAASVFTLTLLLAFALTGWSLYRAETARAAEAQRFGQVRNLARYLLFDLNERLSSVPGNTAARADLAAKAQDYLDILAASPHAPPDLQFETARGLLRLGQIQGVPDEPNLGETENAEANLNRAEAILEGLPPSPQRAVEQARADIFTGLILIHGRAREQDAARRFAAAHKRLNAVPGSERDLEWHRVRRAQRLAMLELADVSEKRGSIAGIAAAMRRDHREWPAALRATDLDESDEAVAAYYEALTISFEDDERATVLFLANEKRFDALLQQRPFDAYLLYRSAWNNFDGFASASRFGREDESARLIAKTNALVDRLLEIDPQDNSVVALAGNAKEGLSQSLRDAGRFDDAIALQQRVVALRRAGLTPERKSRALGNVAFSLAILGVIARDGDRRELACASYTEAEALFAEVAKRGEILGFQENMLAGLKVKKQACATGGSIEGPLRQPD